MNNHAPVFAAPLRRHFDDLSAAWHAPLASVLAQSQTQALCAFVDGRAGEGAEIYPPRPLAALETGSPADVRAVILGQDPYHGPGQATGYAFSVPPGIALPPSLRNILKERGRDVGASPITGGTATASGATTSGANASAATASGATNGSLLGWAQQGVLLLNTVLTVERDRPASHAGKGWEAITDAVIDVLAASPGPRVFFLWGAHAQAKTDRIRSSGGPHLVLQANHPSPLSANRPPVPFVGCGHFSQANDFLRNCGRGAIDWMR
jgi:uracil-DNA glycosylase